MFPKGEASGDGNYTMWVAFKLGECCPKSHILQRYVHWVGILYTNHGGNWCPWCDALLSNYKLILAIWQWLYSCAPSRMLECTNDGTHVLKWNLPNLA